MFANGILTALKPSLEHDRKHVLRLLRLYGAQVLIYLNCKLKTLVYSHSTGTPHFLVKTSTPLCGKFYGFLHHQNRPGHMLKPPNESCERSVFLELVLSQERKSKNSNVNNFLSSCFTFQSELFPKLVFYVENLASISTTYSPLETKTSDHFKDLHKPRLLTNFHDNPTLLVKIVPK